MNAEPKLCLQCGKLLRGRTDKKFCDDNCRNSYNNQLKATTNNYVRNVNNALAKNRRILENLLPADKEKLTVPKEKMIREGFNFKYFTHQLTTQKGATYFYCYDHGYLPLENDWHLIVRKRKD